MPQINTKSLQTLLRHEGRVSDQRIHSIFQNRNLQGKIRSYQRPQLFNSNPSPLTLRASPTPMRSTPNTKTQKQSSLTSTTQKCKKSPYKSNSTRQEHHQKTTVVVLTEACKDLKSPPYSENCQITSSGILISESQLRLVSPSPLPSFSETKALIIADTGNHCIRRLNVLTQKIDTIAGKCGQEGFMDGPLGKSLMSSPSSLGLDDNGDIWVYDRGNRYVRKLKKIQGQNEESYSFLLKTMIKGACRDLPEILRFECFEILGLRIMIRGLGIRCVMRSGRRRVGCRMSIFLIRVIWIIIVRIILSSVTILLEAILFMKEL